MQNLHSGDLVRVRRLRWRVVDVRSDEQCQLVALTGIGPTNVGITRRFLLPFDTVDAVERSTSLRAVRPQRWRRACRALLANHTPPGSLRAARLARIDLLPHQLEPVLAVLNGRGSRLLLADEVGLGKTIQAGLVLAELRARGIAERALILTPAGLREQWAGELSHRFDIGATVVDFREVRQRAARLPVGLNPWATVPVAVASIDYVKQPEVLRTALSCRWDVLVVDEAHSAAPNTDRHAAARALASRTPYVLLLTATPHNGDRRAFDDLCRTGGHGDPLLIFRRTRATVKLGSRRHAHRLHVRPSAAEADMHALLLELTREIRAERRSDDARLALSVLHKRALSSAHALHLSIERRLAALDPSPQHHGHQLMLPLADVAGELNPADAAPAWARVLTLSDPAREQRLLHGLAQAAERAATAETKIAAIRRLLARIAEPVVIFTEYRDTLLHLREALGRPAAILHGGLSRSERADALRDFISGRAGILLATDAAGEGLNLQEQCRCVINLELPWNPMRLEQRVGRVDRIGQRQVVHVFYLIARGTSEERILDRLRSRIARAREDIDVADPIADERAVARLVVDGDVLDEPTGGLIEIIDHRPVDEPAHDRVLVRLEREAAAEAERLSTVRQISCARDEAARAALETAGAWLTHARLRPTRLRLGRRIVVLLRIDYENGLGAAIESTVAPLAISVPQSFRRFDRHEVDSLLRSIARSLEQSAKDASAAHSRQVEFVVRKLIEARLARERAIAQAIVGVQSAPVQAGLFDRRADRELEGARATLDEAIGEITRRLDACSRSIIVRARPPRLLLVLTP